MRSREMSKAFTPVNRLDDEERETRERLLRNARAGDVGALALLREHYGLRLPLVEARLGLESPPAGPSSGQGRPLPGSRTAAITAASPFGSSGCATCGSNPDANARSRSTPRAYAGTAQARRRAPRARSRARRRRIRP